MIPHALAGRGVDYREVSCPVCEQVCRDTVWIPELQKHANTAKRIATVLIVTPKAEEDAKHLARMIAGAVGKDADGSAVVRGLDPAGRYRLWAPAATDSAWWPWR